MDTRQINCLSKSHHKIKKIYAGCFPSNYLPKEKIDNEKLPLLICCNLCSSETREFDACHWISFYIKVGSITLFDSGGEENWTRNENVKEFVKAQDKRVVFNKYQYQPIFSDRCGIYTLCFFNAMSNGDSFHKFLKQFSERDLSRNDEIVWNKFKLAFLKKRKNICKRL